MPKIRNFVSGLVDEFGPLRVESKKKSMAVHTRALPQDQTEAVAKSIRRWSSDNSWVELLSGKEVFELSVATKTKADAVAGLRDEDVTVVFFGDDVTDETVFQTLSDHDVGVKVGPGHSSATQRVADPHEVLSTLLHLSNHRKKA